MQRSFCQLARLTLFASRKNFTLPLVGQHQEPYLFTRRQLNLSSQISQATKGSSGNKDNKSNIQDSSKTNTTGSLSKSKLASKMFGQHERDKNNEKLLENKREAKTFNSTGLSSQRTTRSSGNRIRGMSNAVKHDRRGQRFTMDIDHNQVARIEYKITESPSKSKTLEMYHTEVPKELRGKGFGKELARGTFEQLVALRGSDNIKVKLTCSYLINYMNKCNDPRIRNLVNTA